MFEYFCTYCQTKMEKVESVIKSNIIENNYSNYYALSLFKYNENREVEEDKALPELTAILNYYADLIHSQTDDNNENHTYYLPWNFIKKCIEIIFKEEDK